MITWRIAVPILFCLQAMVAQAAASAWITSEGGDVRLVALPAEADGTIPAILDIRLKEGWKTYWIDPGESGIPPQVTFEQAGGVAFSGIRFPAPMRFDDGTVRYSGYDSSVSLPLMLTGTPGADLSLKASVFLGICKTICIPVQGELTVELPADSPPNLLEKAIIDQAAADLPEAPSESFSVRTSRLDKTASLIRLVLTVPKATDGEMAEIFVAGPAGESFGVPENVVVKGGELTADIPLSGEDAVAKIAGKPLLLVVRAGVRSMQTELAFD